MNKRMKILISIAIGILIFFILSIPVKASIFFDDEEEKDETSIEQTIDNDEGGLFEKIIAKMIRWYSRNGI